jgi:hypothetical protein
MLQHVPSKLQKQNLSITTNFIYGGYFIMACNNKKSKGYFTKNILAKFAKAIIAAKEAVKAGTDLVVRISNKNSKMGEVASVSLVPFFSCPGVCKETCGKKCYAAKLANLRPAVLYSYAINQALVMYRPEIYWASVDLACKAVKYFRFHVAGDILNYEYFENMIQIARNNPTTEILVFTKQYEIVNKWIDINGSIPENMHLLFSGWENLTPNNPHKLPETNIFKTEDEIKENWKICGGNCFKCACRGVGCWQAKTGETIAFKLH